MQKWSYVLLALVSALILGATVLREPVARAAQLVNANITAPLDLHGDVRVHEQGIARVRDITNPGLHPFGSQFLGVVIPPGDADGTRTVTVPANKQLVIEYVSAHASGAGDQSFRVFVRTSADGIESLHVFPAENIGPTTLGEAYVVSSQTRLYADPGTEVFIQLFRDGPGTSETLSVSVIGISGHTVDLS